MVIANSVAYEGIDLQRRTCMIHHIDLPWTPADLQQRNGRAVRQGNKQRVVMVENSPSS
ncbi:helicase-related protein [Nannocystis pusilla]|uniref:helicase-related protein n=1 Tax=Nannocystis pusilla TaxID=889268 RepID=UPI003B7EA2F4